MLRRHGLAALTTTLLVVAVVLLAADLTDAAVYVTLVAIVLAFAGGALNASHRKT